MRLLRGWVASAADAMATAAADAMRLLRQLWLRLNRRTANTMQLLGWLMRVANKDG